MHLGFSCFVLTIVVLKRNSHRHTPERIPNEHKRGFLCLSVVKRAHGCVWGAGGSGGVYVRAVGEISAKGTTFPVLLRPRPAPLTASWPRSSQGTLRIPTVSAAPASVLWVGHGGDSAHSWSGIRVSLIHPFSPYCLILESVPIVRRVACGPSLPQALGAALGRFFSSKWWKGVSTFRADTCSKEAPLAALTRAVSAQ